MVDQVRDVLSGIVDPHVNADLVASGQVDSIDVTGGLATINVILGFPAASWIGALETQITDAVLALESVSKVDLSIESKVVSHEKTRICFDRFLRVGVALPACTPFPKSFLPCWKRYS